MQNFGPRAQHNMLTSRENDKKCIFFTHLKKTEEPPFGRLWVRY